MTDSSSQDGRAGGVLIPRGVALRIPAGALTISFSKESGCVAQVTELHLQLNSCVDWLDIAFDHLRNADHFHRQLMAAHHSGQGAAAFMRSEFLSAMQASVASATFFEALYSATRDCLPESRSALRAGGRRRGARSAHVTEQLKRAFGLKQKGTTNLRGVLSKIYRFRDEAVHPTSAFGPPALHPDLGVLVEPRYVMYNHANARLVVRGALAFCEILPMVGQKQGPKEIQPLARYLLESGVPLFASWRENYGPLRDDDDTR